MQRQRGTAPIRGGRGVCTSRDCVSGRLLGLSRAIPGAEPIRRSCARPWRQTPTAPIRGGRVLLYCFVLLFVEVAAAPAAPDFCALEPVLSSPGSAAVIAIAEAATVDLTTTPWRASLPADAHATATTGLTLTLDQCVHLGVVQSLGLARHRLSTDEAACEVRTARRVLVPTVALAVGQTVDAKQVLTFDQTVSATTLAGTRWGVRAFGNRGIAQPDTQNTRTHSFFLTQPLLKNFGRQVTGHAIEVSELAYAISLARFVGQLDDFIYQLCGLYLDLAFARRNLAIQEQACTRARRQFEDTRHDIELGTIPPHEIYLVEQNVVDFEIKRENAWHQIAQLELDVRKLLATDTTSDMRLFPADPIACPPATGPITWPAVATGTFAEALPVMLANNPDQRIAARQQEKARVDREFARAQSRPGLDLNADYRWREGHSWATHKPQYTIGIEYDIALDRDPDRATVERARHLEEQAQLAQSQTHIDLVAELRSAFLAIDHFRRVRTAKGRVAELAQKKLDAETEKYRNGLSTLADVVRFQRELENAQIDELSTLVELRKRELHVLRLEGRLHEHFGIALDR